MKLDGLVSGFASGLGARFGLIALLPTTLLVAYVLLLLWSGAPGQVPEPREAVAALARQGTAEGILLVLGILVLALVMQPLQLPLVRLLEGYWGETRLAAALSERLTRWQGRQRERLDGRLKAMKAAIEREPGQGAETALARRIATAARLEVRLRRLYPPQRPLLPTRLGNVLRAAETEAGAPYGFDAVTLWPRLYAILPERTAALVDDRRNQLDLAARLCVTFALATAAAVGLLLWHPSPWLLLPVATAGLAWLSYQGAVAAALTYGTALRTAIDLHRFELLAALHLPLPPDREAEKVAYASLSDFLRQGIPVNFVYEHPRKKESAPGHARCGLFSLLRLKRR